MPHQRDVSLFSKQHGHGQRQGFRGHKNMTVPVAYLIFVHMLELLCIAFLLYRSYHGRDRLEVVEELADELAERLSGTEGFASGAHSKITALTESVNTRL